MSGILIGHHAEPDGEPARGHVEVRMSVDEARAASGKILKGRTILPLDVNGDYRVEVAGFNEPGVVPQGITYSVEVHTLGGSIGPVTGIRVDNGQTVNVNEQTSVDPTAPVYPVEVTRQQFLELDDRVDALETTGGAAPQWGNILNKPTSFTPAPHRHEATEIDNFDDETELVLDGIDLSVIYLNARA